MPEVEEALKTQLTTQFGGSFSPETAGRAAGFVFPQADGVTRRQGLHYLKRCIQKIPGMQHVRIHDLRHTFASWFLQRGVDPLAVQAALGHSTLAMTSRYARHSTDTQQALFRRAGLPVQTQSGIKPIQKLEKEEEK
jgi:integrase